MAGYTHNGEIMFTPSVPFQQSIQNIQSKVHEDIAEVKSAMQPRHLEKLNEIIERINSKCTQILSLLSSRNMSQPNSFSPAERSRSR